MNEFESFTGSEQAEGFDPSAFERFQEKMRENAKQGKKDKAREKKQQADESDLYQILKHIILTLGVTHPLANALISCLSSSVNPHLVVIALSLNFQSLQKKLQIQFKNSDKELSKKQSIQLNNFDKTLPEFIKFNLALYFQKIQSEFQSEKEWNLMKFKEYSDSAPAFKNLISIVIQEYLQINNQNFNGENVIEFAENFINTLLESNHIKIDSKNNSPKTD